ncbi:MAG: deoxyribodipyrimidine photo-lyase [Verrucomicrobiota bacterium JB023]|nr:deoxyribodipyrimidine photo-lyase [Verrucomicrobiota bacterium JB023]
MSSPSHRVAIHWFRRDLRVSDNTALHQAWQRAEKVVPVYILSDWEHSHAWTGPGREHFLCECLRSLAGNLSTLEGRLILRQGAAVDELAKLARETKATAIFYNRDPDPFGKAIESQLETVAEELGLELCPCDDVSMHRFDETTKDDGTAYRVYTPYSKRWLNLEKRAPVPKPERLNTPESIPSLPLPTLETWQLSLPGHADFLPGGEKAARERLTAAVDERLTLYAELRDAPAAEATSRLSQDLRWGTISIRTVYERARHAQGAASSGTVKDSFQKYIKELAWRDFYLHLLEAFPEVLETEFNPDYRNLPWDEPGDSFEAWKAGRTGFPIVDAGMRELLTTGFIHNRVRMIVAMFLTKDLHLDWRLGEQHFAQHLLDGEIASNNGGWQWSAGTGADAAPYFRIQNPWTQSARHDPKGDYIKRWVPELASVPASKLHAPPEAGPLASSYPVPILDHGRERDRTLAIFKKHREEIGKA